MTMAKKEVEVETVDPELFQAIMSLVVKDADGNYLISLKDICRCLNLNVSAVNEFVTHSYEGLRRYGIPHLELSLMDKNMVAHYITSGERYELSEYDVFCVTPFSMAALPYVLLDLIKYQNIETKYDVRFACVFSLTVTDCFEYTHMFDTTGN